jgi:predicted phosphoribosyltransferase
VFADRASAGQTLATQLSQYAGLDDVVVLGLPRGGVVVAAEVATALGAPLDVCVVRKLGVPGREELAFGAVGDGGALVLNTEVVHAFRLTDDDIQGVVRRETVELRRRELAYRGESAPPISLTGSTAILVDDGLATGASMRAAVQAVQTANPARIVVAVPVAAAATCALLKQVADEVVSVETPTSFIAVGQWYLDFRQTTDNEVRDLLSVRR